jgi:hypothetical protein
MGSRVRAFLSVASDVVIAVGAIGGTFWIAYASAHGAHSSVTLLGHRVRFVHELLIGAGLTLIGVFRGIPIAWRARRDRRALASATSALAEGAAREKELWRRLGGVLGAQLVLVAKLAEIGSDDRVSFFIDDPTAAGLRLADRYSVRQTYGRVDPERLYPYSAGCLGEAWDSGEPVYHCFCDPAADEAQWSTELEKWGISREESAGMTLKARTVFARRVDTNELPESRLGVVVVESPTIAADDGSPISELRLRAYFGARLALLASLFQLAIDLRMQRTAATPSATPSRIAAFVSWWSNRAWPLAARRP